MQYANKEIREIYYSAVNTKHNSTVNMIKILQNKIKISNFYDEMKHRRQSNSFQFEGDPFSKDIQGNSKHYREILLLMNFLQTKPKIKSMNNNYYDLYYTVNKTRDDEEIEEYKCENIENDCINFDVFFTPEHYIGKKRWCDVKVEKMRSQINHFK